MDNFISLFFFSLIVGITPGPNNIMLMTSGLNFGVKKTIPHSMGVVIGYPLMFILTGIGLSAIFERYPLINEVIRAFSIIYLFYLAYRIANANPMDKTSSRSKSNRPLYFIEALLFQWVNPKTWMIATTLISSYLNISMNFYIQVFIIAMVMFVTSCLITATWVLFGKVLQRILTQKKHVKIFNIIMATLLVISILPVVDEVIQTWL